MDLGKEQLISQRQQPEFRISAQAEQEQTRRIQESQVALENAQQVQEIQQPVLQQAPVQHLPEGQQQQMNRKEQKSLLRRQERERKKAEEEQLKHEQKIAKAHIQIGITASQIMSEQNSGARATNMTLSEYHVCVGKVEQLEQQLDRVIVTRIKDVRQATEYLVNMKKLRDLALKRDEEIRNSRVRTIQVPMYIQEVMKKALSEDMNEALNRERIREMNAINSFQEEFDKLQGQISRVGEQQKEAQVEQREQEDQQQMAAYEQRLKEIMERSPGITKERAREQCLNEILCPTLKNFEQARVKNQEAITRHALEGYDYVNFANVDLRKAGFNHRLTLEEAEALTKEYLHDYMNQQNSFQIRVPNCDIMQRIIRSGRFKTQMESVQSFGGVNNVAQRKGFTQTKFGADINTLQADMYEVYGYLSHGDLVKETKPWIDPKQSKKTIKKSEQGSFIGRQVSQYGQVVVKLKKDRMKNRTTAVIGDSLTESSSAISAWQDRMDLLSVGGGSKSNIIVNAYRYKKAKEAGADVSEFLDYDQAMYDLDGSYTELQFHGQVTLDDIESVTLLANAQGATEGAVIEKEMPEELLEMLHSLGIKAQIVKEDGLHEV